MKYRIPASHVDKKHISQMPPRPQGPCLSYVGTQ